MATKPLFTIYRHRTEIFRKNFLRHQQASPDGDAISTEPALSCREARTENLKPHTAVKALDRHRFYTRPTPLVSCHRQHEKNREENSTDTALRVRALDETRVASLL